MKERALKEGDYIKIINPVLVNRFGYPLNTRIIKNQFTPEQRKQVENFFRTFVTGAPPLNPTEDIIPLNQIDFAYDYKPDGLGQVFHGLAYGMLKAKGHGGNERKLYTQEFPELKDGIARIIERKVVKTGKRVPGSGGYDYWGEYDYEPGYLEDEQTHVLYQIGNVYVGPEMYHLTNDNYNIVVYKANIFTSMPEFPIYIEKKNVELYRLSNEK
jgi:hypothetical protein